MKKITVLMVVAAAIISCKKESIVLQDSVEKKEFTIGIMPVGDISASYSPLTKSGDLETTWYGINIKRDGSSYLVGLYDDISKFKVQLSTEHSYSFEISAIKNADDFILSNTIRYYTSVGYNEKQGLAYKFPFNVSDADYIIGNEQDEYFVFHWSQGGCPTSRTDVVNRLSNQIHFVNNGSSLNSDKSLRYAVCSSFPYLSVGKNSNEWYRFYGTKNNFTPSKDEVLPFTLKHEGFGLQYTVSGICDGSVSVIIDNAQTENTITYFSQPAISSNYTSPKKVIEFRSMASETEQVKVSVVWTRGNNVVDNLGSTTINVRRNKLNKVNITLGEHSSSKTMSVSTDASDYFGNESSSITI